MEIGSSPSVAASAAALGGPSSSSTPDAMGPEAFMRLLVAQIRNQDPMQPMDTEAMMGQLTQLTEVERLVAIDGRLETLGLATAGMANSQAADLVGRYVEADTSHVLLTEGQALEGTFQLGGPAASATVELRDGSGHVVRTLHLGATRAGTAHFDWDGLDDTGAPCPTGRYSVSVSAVDTEGSPVTVELAARGFVDTVTYEGGYPALSIAGSEVVMGDVRSIGGEPEPAPTATP